MFQSKRFLIPLVCVAFGYASVSAQPSRTFKTRLSPVPIDVSMQSTIAGTGSVTAVLTGTKLAITGTFDGLKSPATIAQLHKSPVRGVRGPVVFDVAVTRGDGSSGTLSGTFDLTPLQVADLEKGRLYVQVHSEKAPDGNLWGWLTPQENKR
jgi:CHRD domain